MSQKVWIAALLLMALTGCQSTSPVAPPLPPDSTNAPVLEPAVFHQTAAGSSQYQLVWMPGDYTNFVVLSSSTLRGPLSQWAPYAITDQTNTPILTDQPAQFFAVYGTDTCGHSAWASTSLLPNRASFVSIAVLPTNATGRVAVEFTSSNSFASWAPSECHTMMLALWSPASNTVVIERNYRIEGPKRTPNGIQGMEWAPSTPPIALEPGTNIVQVNVNDPPAGEPHWFFRARQLQ